jgi:uncharacterized membrane protein YidH (DUF202 family)
MRDTVVVPSDDVAADMGGLKELDRRTGGREAERVMDHAALIQVILAEKRTSLSVMRTAIAILAVPLSITTVLVTLSRFYSWLENLHFLIPMYVVLIFLLVVSLWLLLRAAWRIRHYDEMISELRKRHPLLRDVLD